MVCSHPGDNGGEVKGRRVGLEGRASHSRTRWETKRNGGGIGAENGAYVKAASRKRVSPKPVSSPARDDRTKRR